MGGIRPEITGADQKVPGIGMVSVKSFCTVVPEMMWVSIFCQLVSSGELLSSVVIRSSALFRASLSVAIYVKVMGSVVSVVVLSETKDVI